MCYWNFEASHFVPLSDFPKFTSFIPSITALKNNKMQPRTIVQIIWKHFPAQREHVKKKPMEWAMQREKTIQSENPNKNYSCWCPSNTALLKWGPACTQEWKCCPTNVLKLVTDPFFRCYSLFWWVLNPFTEWTVRWKEKRVIFFYNYHRNWRCCPQVPVVYRPL